MSSERRLYVPIGFIDGSSIVTNLALFIPDATIYHFGVLTSQMHNAWMRAVCGRLEMRYRYSKDVVYNNFVWPDPPAALKAKIEASARTVLDVRRRWMDADERCSLAVLYDPDTMPPDLVEAHARLDALVDRAYGRAFAGDSERVAHLFLLYAKAVGSEKR